MRTLKFDCFSLWNWCQSKAAKETTRTGKDLFLSGVLFSLDTMVKSKSTKKETLFATTHS